MAPSSFHSGFATVAAGLHRLESSKPATANHFRCSLGKAHTMRQRLQFAYHHLSKSERYRYCGLYAVLLLGLVYAWNLWKICTSSTPLSTTRHCSASCQRDLPPSLRPDSSDEPLPQRWKSICIPDIHNSTGV